MIFLNDLSLRPCSPDEGAAEGGEARPGSWGEGAGPHWRGRGGADDAPSEGRPPDLSGEPEGAAGGHAPA